MSGSCGPSSTDEIVIRAESCNWPKRGGEFSCRSVQGRCLTGGNGHGGLVKAAESAPICLQPHQVIRVFSLAEQTRFRMGLDAAACGHGEALMD